MDVYNDAFHKEHIELIVGEIYYSDVSFDLKIQRIRTLSEYIIRRLVRQAPQNALLLGDARTITALHKHGVLKKDLFFWNAYNLVCKMGNKSSHSGSRNLPDEASYNKVIDAIIDLYAYLYLDYFRKHPFGTNDRVMSSFSILPPVFRGIVLRELLLRDPTNRVVIEKLLLAWIKAYGIKQTRQLIDQYKENLTSIQMPYSSVDIQVLLLSGLSANETMTRVQESIYEYCIRECESPRFIPLDHKQVYKNYEEAKSYYLRYGVINNPSPEEQEFNSLMEYIYIGRRAPEKSLDVFALHQNDENSH